VLEAAGYRVEIPPRSLCCGRPLYDFGMLDLAVRQLRQILETLRPWIREGIPVVGLEPSCVTVFRDEMPCREQIEQATGRRALHLAEVMRMALRAEAGAEPEERSEAAPAPRPLLAAAVAGGALLLAGWAAREALGQRSGARDGEVDGWQGDELVRRFRLRERGHGPALAQWT